jgi:hypothetical protein
MKGTLARLQAQTHRLPFALMSHEIAADAPTIIEHEIASSEMPPVVSRLVFSDLWLTDA